MNLSELITQRSEEFSKKFTNLCTLVVPRTEGLRCDERTEEVKSFQKDTALMIIEKMLEMVEAEKASELRMACLCLKDCDCARNAIFDGLKALLLAEKGKVEGTSINLADK